MKKPILLIHFNRPDLIDETLSVLKEIRPEKIYISIDGPRNNKDKKNQEEILKKVDNINWTQVILNHEKENLGCHNHVPKAINWFFEKNKDGIILEDDCIPNKSFFGFCEELLNKYKEDKKIMMISGANHNIKTDKFDYYFSRYPQIWGWATWSDRWNKFAIDNSTETKLFEDKEQNSFWKSFFKKIESGKLKNWGAKWTKTIIKENGFCIIPNKNLITNKGFDNNATNTKIDVSNMANLKTSEINLPLSHPEKISESKNADRALFEKVYKTSFMQKIKFKISQIVN